MNEWVAGGLSDSTLLTKHLVFVLTTCIDILLTLSSGMLIKQYGAFNNTNFNNSTNSLF